MRGRIKLCLGAFLFCVSSVYGGEIERTVSFSKNDLTFSKSEGYDVVDLKGYPGAAGAGEPRLPKVVHAVAIPAGASLTGVEIVSRDMTEIAGVYDIMPASPHIPLPMPGRTFLPALLKADPKIYSSDKLYPETEIRIAGIGSMNGYQIVHVELFPVRYLPAENMLRMATRITYRLNYVESAVSVSVPTALQHEVFGNAVRSIVCNPEDVSSFSPRIGLPEVDLTTTNKDLPRTVLSSAIYPYVIITQSPMDTVFQRLADWKTKKGVRATVVTVDWITANYTGYDTQEKIRNFIIDARDTWGTTYVLLGGQGDQKTSGQNIIPARRAYYTTCGAGYYSDEDMIPSDLYYSDLDGTWDADGDHTYGELGDDVDMYADVYVGRAPVYTVAQAQNFVYKTLTYEKSPPSNHIKKLMLPTAILWSSYEERPIQDRIAQIIPGEWFTTKMYERNGTLSRQGMIDSLNVGYAMGHWEGHGFEDGIYKGSYPYLNSSDAVNLANGDRLGVVNSIACFTGAWDQVSGGDCFAEHLVNCVGGGLVATMMNSRYGWGAYVDGYVPGPSERIDTTFYAKIFQSGMYHVGAVHAAAKDAWVPYADMSSQYSKTRWCIYELNLLGDPELPLWTEVPEVLSVTHNATVPMGTSSFTVTVTNNGSGVEGALVCCMMDSTLYETGYTNSAGQVVLSVTPSHAATMRVTVTARNYIPNEGYATVTSSSEYGSVAGTVTRGGVSLPVEGALIEIVGTGLMDTSDASGEYRIDGIGVGTYDVTCSAIGYSSKTESGVVIMADATTTVDFALDVPAIQVSPDSLGASLTVGSSIVDTLFISNSGTETLTFSIVESITAAAKSTGSISVREMRRVPGASNTAGKISFLDKRRLPRLSETTIPAVLSLPLSPDEDTIRYDDGTAYYYYGGNAHYAVRFTPDGSCNVLAADVMAYDPNSVGATCSLFVWDDDGGVPGNVIAGPIAYTPSGHPDWDRVELTLPVNATEDFYIGYLMPGDPDGQYALSDESGGTRSIYSTDGGVTWDGVTDGDLMIRAIVENAEHDPVSWLSENLSSGSVPPGETEVILVTFNSAALTIDTTYKAWLRLNSNDPDEPVVSVPVVLTVVDTVTSKDVGTVASIGSLDTVFVDSTYSPRVQVTNFGVDPVLGFSVICKIDTSGYDVYTDTRSVSGLAGGDTTTVSFSSWTVPAPRVDYTLTLFTQCPDDTVPGNDTLSIVLREYNDAPIMSALPDTSFLEGDSFQVNLDDYVLDTDDPDAVLEWDYSISAGEGEILIVQMKSEFASRKMSPQFTNHDAWGHPPDIEEEPIHVSIHPVTHVATITADPDWSGERSIVFVAEDPWGLSGRDTMLVTVNPVESDTAVLSIVRSTGLPGTDSNIVCVNLENFTGVAGIQISIGYDTLLTAGKARTTSRSAMMDISSSIGEDSIQILLFNSSCDTILSGMGSIIEIPFYISPNAKSGDSTLLHIDRAMVSDVGAGEIPSRGVNGWVCFEFPDTTGNKGDVNCDESVDILDIVRTVGIVQGFGNPPTSYELWAADVKEDGDINILDVVAIVNIVQGGKGSVAASTLPSGDVRISVSREISLAQGIPSVSSRDTAIASISCDVGMVGTDGNMVYVDLENLRGVAGVQIRITHNTLILAREAETTDRSTMMTIDSKIDSNCIQVLLFNTSLDTIAFGSGPILRIPFYISPDAKSGDSVLLQIERVILSDVDASEVLSQSADGWLHFRNVHVDGGVLVPGSYEFSGVFPNPVSQQATIRYAVPGQSHTTLKVYDVSGKLVRTLVNENQNPAYHSVAWSGRDDRGRKLSPGVYFVRFSARSTDASVQARRHTSVSKVILAR